MMNIKPFLIFIILFIIFIPQKASAIIGDVGDLTGDNIDVKITAQNFSGQADSDVFHIWGNVNVKKEDACIQADDVVYNTKTNIAVASGNVYFTRPGTELSGNKVTVKYKEKTGVWEGYVTLVQSNPPEKGGDRVQKAFKDGPVKMISDVLEFSWSVPGRVVASGLVEAHQKDKTLYADEAIYESPPEIITLQGHVRLQRDDGSFLECGKMVMDLKANKFEAENQGSQVRATVFVKNKKKIF